MTLANPKRRRTTLVAIAASLVAILGGALAFAHSGAGHHGPMMAQHSTDDHLEHMQAMLTRIGASEAQKAQIEGILKPALEDVRTTHETFFGGFKEFHEAIAAPSIDRARLESLRAAQVKIIDDASKRLVIAISDAAEVLSPEQRAALAQEIEKHHRG
ncbi:MAG: periplasmic heavy metal sensor [Pseudomonadota bacterium]